MSGTTGNDTFNAAAGTFAATDVVVDSTTTDTDVLNLAMNSYTSTQAVVTNIETISATSPYASVGVDAANVTGTKVLNLAAGIDGSVGTAEGISSTKVAKVVAGSNIGTLRVNSVNALTTGTGTTVTVDAGKAATVAVGNAAAAATDTYDITVAAGSTTTLAAGNGGTDTFTLNLSGGAHTLTIANAVAATADINVLNIVAGGSSASTITLSSAADVIAGSSTGDVVNIRGTQNLTIKGDGDAFAGTTAINGPQFTKAAGAGTVTLESNATLGSAPTFFNRAVVDRLVLSTVATGKDITINDNTELAMTFANGTRTYNVGNTSTTGVIAAGGGTLKISLEGTSVANAIQTSITTGLAVGTTVIKNDTIASTISTLDTAATATSTDTVVVSGSKALTVSTWTATAGEVFTASGLTGSLTLGIGTTGASVIGGSGADTITSGAASDSINGGAGADRIVGVVDGDADTLTGGNGSDVFVVGDITAQDVITDFSVNDATKGTDVIALSGGLLTDQLVNGAGADVANGTAARLVQVSGATTTAAADNVFVITGTFANAAAVKTAVEAGGTRVITLGGNSAANTDYLLVWSDGTDTYLSAYLDATGTATALAGGTMTALVKLTGLASVDTLTSANFAFVA